MSTQNALNNSFGSAGNSHDHLSKEFGLGGLSQLSLQDELLSLNDSLMSNYSANSVFYKTIKDKKKEKTINLYYKEIAPRLIRLIRKEIITKYDQIYENISTPMKNNSEKFILSSYEELKEQLNKRYIIVKKRKIQKEEKEKLESLFKEKKEIEDRSNLDFLSDERISLKNSINLSHEINNVIMNSNSDLNDQEKQLEKNTIWYHLYVESKIWHK